MNVSSGMSPVESVLKRDRKVSIGALFVVVALSWAWVLAGAGMGMSAFDMSSLSMALGQGGQMPMTGEGMGASMAAGMSAGMASVMLGRMQAMATPAGWTAGYAVLMFFMWWIMMVAMMLPSAAPTVLLYAVVNRKAQQSGRSAGTWSTAVFTAGYLLSWPAFSVVAASLQWAFE